MRRKGHSGCCHAKFCTEWYLWVSSYRFKPLGFYGFLYCCNRPGNKEDRNCFHQWLNHLTRHGRAVFRSMDNPKRLQKISHFTGSKLINIWGGCPGYPQVSITGEIPEEPLFLGCQMGLNRASCWDAPAESLLLPVPVWNLPPGGHVLPRRSWAPSCWFDGSQQCYQKWSWAVKWNVAVPPSVHKAIVFAMLPQCNNVSVYEKA